MATHDRLVVQAVPRLHGCDVILLAQFSTSTAWMQAQEGAQVPVLSAPDAAVRERLEEKSLNAN